MKKLSVFLSILTLMGALPVGAVSALSGDGEANGEGMMLASESGEQGSVTELPVLHELNRMFHIQAIAPRNGTVDVEVDAPTGQILQIKRVWFATMDYEDGWTEAEVDAQLDNWGALEAEWARVTKEYLFDNAVGSHTYATIGFDIEGTRWRYDLTQVNLPDVLYYAAEFREMKKREDEGGYEDTGKESVWVRGKVNYRGCAHATRFLEGQTEMCVEMVDWDAMTAKYWPAEAVEDEEVVTWNEEWRLVLAGRLEGVGVILDGLAMLPMDAAEALEYGLGQEEAKLDAIEELLEKMTGVGKETAKAAQLRGRIAALRSDVSSEGDEGGETGEGSGNGGSEVVGSGEGSGDNVGGVAGDVTGVITGVDDRGEEVAGGMSGDGAEGSSDKGSDGGELDGAYSGATEVAYLGTVSGGYLGTVSGASGGGAASEGNESDLGVKIEESEGEASSSEPEKAEVPKLGEVKVSRSGWIWWVVGVSGVLSLLLVLVLKRKQGKDRQR